MINRARTAIKRKELSAPVKELLALGVFEGKTVLDFGCGAGLDVIKLRELGYTVDGYDKFQQGWGILQDKNYDVVMCNYVLNVVELPEERQVILKQLRKLGSEVYVTVRTDHKSIRSTWQPYNDGWLTPIGTFQKIYSIQEFESEYSNMSKLYAKNNAYCTYKCTHTY